MNNTNIDTLSDTLKEYPVWDRTTRWFHWINTLAIIGLIGVGLVILNAKTLGISTDGKILLKTIHVYIGYLFCLNLAWLAYYLGFCWQQICSLESYFARW